MTRVNYIYSVHILAHTHYIDNAYLVTTKNKNVDNKSINVFFVYMYINLFTI